MGRKRIRHLDKLKPGTVVYTPFPDMESNVAEKTSDGFWLVTGEEALFTSADLDDMMDAPFWVLREGYGD